MKITLYQRLKLRLGHIVYLEHKTRPGWKGSLPFYAFRCKKHGIAEDYPHGHDERLYCPECTLEFFEEIENE